MALEVVDAMKRQGKGIVLKIDFEKTYDCVDWEFLWFVMDRMGFS